MKRLPMPPKDELRRLYLDERLSQLEIAHRLMTNETTVRRWLDAADLPRLGLHPWLNRPTAEEMRRLHVDEKKSTEEIGRMFGVNGRTIRMWMEKAGIERLGNKHLRGGVSATWNIGRKRSPETIEKMRAVRLGSVPPNKGRGSVWFTCAICGIWVFDKPYRRKIFCSEACRNTMMSELRGEKHWNYVSADPPSNQRQRLWAQCREWRRSVMDRDGHTCVVCGQHGGRLVAHHLEPWAEAVELRFAINNGVTLCRNDHLEFHRARGWRRGATRAAFEDWAITKKKC